MSRENGVIGSEILVVSTTAVPLQNTFGTVGFGALSAFITVEAQPIRYWESGAVPTAGAGHLKAAGTTIDLLSPFAVRNFLAIRQGGVDATLHVTYFG
jgi:hypothetical protein